MKKLTALLLILIITFIPFASLADAPYEDSNGTKTNAIIDPTVAENFNQFNAATSEIMSKVAEDGNSYSWTVKSDIKPGGMYEAYLKGAVMRVNDDFAISTAFKVPAGKALVFQLPVKNVGSSNSVRVNAALINSGSWGEANVPVECGEDGIVVTDTENWGIIGFTLVMPGSQGTEYKPRLFFGFPEGTGAGQAIAINLNEPNIPKAFVAIEEPYRIKVKSDYYDALSVGESINLTAEVWNQIASKGTLDQEAITWYVTDSQRNQKIETNNAFIFKKTDAGMSLTIGAKAPSGSYAVVAESTENPCVRYGVDIKVETEIPEKEQPVEENEESVTEEEKESGDKTSPAVTQFSDVHGANHWAREYVDYVCTASLMNGTSKTEFSPDVNLSRAMLVTVLHRLDGSESVSSKNIFADVVSGAYYEKAVAWAHEKGIVNGVSDAMFAPDASITREQIATIMHRYARYKGYDVSVGENTNILSYDDFGSISEYAVSAVQYAAGSGMIGGKTASTINPLDNATRAEAAAILMRFANYNK